MSDADRFAAAARLNQTAPADADFLRRAEDAGRYYQNSPGSDPVLLGMRDTIMDFVDRRLKALETRMEQRLDETERRTATAPTRKSTGIDWSRFKTMDADQQKAAIDAASTMDMVRLFAGKNEENFQTIESRLARLEKDLTIKEFAASILEG